ncbi:reverse transcriptase [Phytophthora cinnamomi]|uniref:reverse transcriptase n=1 Tax=Phytophthora cinnamomi TaxID=4785 RepID=UPI00355A8FF6|nr:reverse transcriptase [Phytophthora cinnamomi]
MRQEANQAPGSTAATNPLNADQAGSDPVEDEQVCIHESGDLHAEDVEAEMAVLPEVTVGTADVKIEDIQVGDPEINSPEEIERLRGLIWKRRHLLIGKGNALPPAARGVVCDIDVGDARPIAQRVRKVAPQFREKLSDLIKGLLGAQIIKASISPWASPIVVIIKKNGVNIRLCIDYRLVNSLTRLMIYPMPLINDLLEDLDKVLWYCSLDMASGFWVVTMTDRARAISAFITPFGLFEWNRMPFGLKNAPQIYQRMLDNALYGFTRIPRSDKSGSGSDDDRADFAPEHGDLDSTTQHFPRSSGSRSDGLGSGKHGSGRFGSGDPISGRPGSDMSRSRSSEHRADLHPASSDRESSIKPSVLGRRSYIDDILVTARSWDHLCERVDDLLETCDEWNISISVVKSFWGKAKVEYLGHKVSNSGLEANPKDLSALADLPFPGSLRSMQSFLGSLNYYSRFIEDYAIYAAILYELREVDFAAMSKAEARAQIKAHLDQPTPDHIGSPSQDLRSGDLGSTIGETSQPSDLHPRGVASTPHGGEAPRSALELQASGYPDPVIPDLEAHNPEIPDLSSHSLKTGDLGLGGLDEIDPRWIRGHRAFAKLKSKVASTPILRHFNSGLQPVVVVYANDWAISAALMQEHDGIHYPVTFVSRTLKSNELNYGIVEKEVLALLRILDLGYNMLVGRPIKVLTRYPTLAWLFRSPGLQGRLGQWAALLSPWTLEIVKCTKGEDEILGAIAASITPDHKWIRP